MATSAQPDPPLVFAALRCSRWILGTLPGETVSQFPVLLFALAAGLLVGLLDNSPGWDDTGITVGALLLASALMGLLAPRLPWLWGLAAGAWVPLIGLAQLVFGADYRQINLPVANRITVTKPFWASGKLSRISA